MSWQTLARLPESFRTRLDRIHFTAPRGNLGGWVTLPQKTVNLTPAGTSPYVLIHEMAHAWQGGNPAALEDWSRQFWGRSTSALRRGSRPKAGGSVSRYGNTNPWEDMAESVAHYVTDARAMQASQPERYAFIRDKLFRGTEHL